MLDVLIIGGGAAGLFLAANLQSTNAALLEHGPEAGKKLLITGGGMCNITNTLPLEQFLSHYGNRSQRNFLLPSLHVLSPSALMQWFEHNGVSVTVREDGKVFPSSLDAHQVRDVLLKQSKAVIHYNTKVKSTTHENGVFTVESERRTFQAKRLVLATGGMSYPGTGSDGSGYALAKSLGHSIVPPKPALAALSIKEYQWAHLAGNSIRNANADFYHAGERKRFLQQAGDILLTHDGLSGPLILKASRYLESGDRITFSLLPELAKQTLQDAILSQQKRQITTILKEFGLISSIAQQVVKAIGLASISTPAHLTKQQRQELLRAVMEVTMTIQGVKGFKSAMVTSGGVSLSEVNRGTMESKVREHLYFAGEILDIDGESGGFNLQAAFSTAYCVAKQMTQ
ncbi:MAG: NAD(P)/FAD-dependent oxidoreductase [Sphaerochaeta sp.]